MCAMTEYPVNFLCIFHGMKESKRQRIYTDNKENMNKLNHSQRGGSVNEMTITWINTNVDMENFHKQTKHQLFDYCTHIHKFIPLPKHNKPWAPTLIQISIYVITVHIQFMVYALMQYKQMSSKHINTGACSSFTKIWWVRTSKGGPITKTPFHCWMQMNLNSLEIWWNIFVIFLLFIMRFI